MKLAKWMVIAALAAGTDASADPAVSAVYANGAWAGLADGTPVAVEGGTATIGANAFATGDEAVACYGGTPGEGRTLVFLGDGSASSISGFGGLRVRADGMVRIGGALSGVAIEIDARGFEGNTKRVLAAEGGFGDDPSASVVGEGFGWRVLGNGQTLLLVSPRVVDTFVNTDWTEADVYDQFVGDTALVWGGNAFNALAAAAAALGTNGTLHLDGGSSIETITLAHAANQVVVLPNPSAVAAGRIAGAGGALTVEARFSATALSGFSTLTVKAGRGSLDVSEDIRLTENGVLNFDLAGVDIPGLGDGSSYALVGELSKVQGGPAFVATVDGTEAIGTYNLARGAAGFDGTVALKDPQGNALGTLSPGGAAVETTDRTYALALADSPPGRLVLTVGRPPVLYYDPVGGTNAVCSVYTPYAGETTLASGWWVVAGARTTDARIAVSGDVHLILRDGASLTAAKGIDVGADGANTNSLTIWAQSDGDGMGALAASGGYSYAGIGGGGNYGAGGTVTVNGGTVVAEGGEEGGAGIGGGLWGDGCTVAINGGTVVAAGRAAGNVAIGHGAAGSVNGDLVFPGMKVYAAEGGDPVAAADRMAACRGRWAKLAVCDPHAFTAGVDNGDTHSVRCAYCGASNGATEPHAFANGVCASCGATEPPSVSDVVARQRWPWNGLVDVDYEVGGYTTGMVARLSFAASDGRSWIASNFLAGAEPSAEPGAHRATWDTAADGATNVVAGSVAATVELLQTPAPPLLSPVPVTPEPTAGARKLYSFLLENYGRKVVSGVMTERPFENDGNYTPQGYRTQTELKYVHDASGKDVVLVGLDFLHATGLRSGEEWYQGYTAASLALAKTVWNAGGIPAFCWHWKDPMQEVESFYTQSSGNVPYTEFGIGRAYDATNGTWKTESAEYQAIVRDLEAVADRLLELQEAGVAVVWRPLHEASDRWFWWGTDGPGPCVALYRLMFDVFVNRKGLRNLIWVWTTDGTENALDWYPGDDCVDVVGRDFYYHPRRGDHASLVDLFTAARDLFGGRKIVALTENGAVPYPAAMKADGAGWSWFMPWYGDYAMESWANDNDADSWNTVMNDEYTLTLEDMPGWE